MAVNVSSMWSPLHVLPRTAFAKSGVRASAEAKLHRRSEGLSRNSSYVSVGSYSQSPTAHQTYNLTTHQVRLGPRYPYSWLEWGRSARPIRYVWDCLIIIIESSISTRLHRRPFALGLERTTPGFRLHPWTTDATSATTSAMTSYAIRFHLSSC